MSVFVFVGFRIHVRQTFDPNALYAMQSQTAQSYMTSGGGSVPSSGSSSSSSGSASFDPSAVNTATAQVTGSGMPVCVCQTAMCIASTEVKLVQTLTQLNF